jgi:hypothetical protein
VRFRLPRGGRSFEDSPHFFYNKYNNNNNNLLTASGLSPGGSGYFTYKQQLVPTKFKTGGLHEKHVVATWNLGSHLSIYL